MSSQAETTNLTAGQQLGGNLPRLLETLLWMTAAVIAFQGAHYFKAATALVVVYLLALLQLARAKTWRGAFYPGIATGFLIAAIALSFFWTIFSAGAVALWLVYAFWIGLFVALARIALRSGIWGWTLIPFLWCGLEYSRSELYYLKFAWLTPGFAFAGRPGAVPLGSFGTYGLGFLLVTVASTAIVLWQSSKIRSFLMIGIGIAVIRLSALLVPGPVASHQTEMASLRIAGIQMEFPTANEVLVRLNELVRKHGRPDLIVLSEYTFEEPIPDKVLKWCREHRVYLIAGAKEAAPRGDFYNTACVVSPAGEIVFRQVKSVPIQFFKDGLRAPEQRLWKSPWGKIGICICYDLSYARVTDRLVRLGAQALIVPTMDVADWGQRQHRLHARVAPVRAREYGIPVFRIASSGISQSVDRTGLVRASAPFPGDGAVMLDTLQLAAPGTLPIDRWLAPLSTGLTILFIAVAFLRSILAKTKRKFEEQPAESVSANQT